MSPESCRCDSGNCRQSRQITNGDQDRRLKRAELKKKEKGSSGGIRVVLPFPVVDPLLKPLAFD